MRKALSVHVPIGTDRIFCGPPPPEDPAESRRYTNRKDLEMQGSFLARHPRSAEVFVVSDAGQVSFLLLFVSGTNSSRIFVYPKERK